MCSPVFLSLTGYSPHGQGRVTGDPAKVSLLNCGSEQQLVC